MEYNIKNMTAYLHRVDDRIRKYVDAIRTQIEENVLTWEECEQLAEATNVAEWVGHQVGTLERVAKDQRFNIFQLYRCIKRDPLEVLKEGKLYRLRPWYDTYIVCGEGFSIGKKNLAEYFERVPKS